MSTAEKFSMVRTAAAWIDLLGYDSDLQSVAGLLGSPPADKVIERAFAFQRSIQEWISQDTRIVVLNDGCLISADLEPAGDAYQGHYWRKSGADFVRHVVRIHRRINEEDVGPGARMVVCLGQRVHRGSEVPNLQRRHLRNTSFNIEKQATDPLTAQHDVHAMFVAEANDPTVVSTRHLQHNIAFARAYQAESLGSKIGLIGKHAYIDSRLLSSEDSSGFDRIATVPLLGETITFLRATD